MPVNLKFARPFIVTDATGRKWEVGIAVYENMDNSWAAHPLVQVHTEEAVRARGGWLAQWRWLNNVRPADPKALPMLIWVGRPEAPEYVDGIEGGWSPVWFQNLRHFPNLEIPYADFVQVGHDPATGEPTYQMIGSDERIQLSTHQGPRVDQAGATKLWPGDPSPVLGAAGDLDLGRHEREEHEHFRQQTDQLRATNAEAARYVDASPDPVPIPWVQPTPYYLLVDPRDHRHL